MEFDTSRTVGKTETECVFELLNMPCIKYIQICQHLNIRPGPGLLNELGSWITLQLLQAYHQYGVGSRPAL